MSFDLEVPPGVREHVETAEHEVGRDIVLYSVTPHMHYRGRWAVMEVERPDGSVEPLLSVPRYRFDWQRTYVLARPRPVPRGSRVRIRAGYDNSVHNPANPDPTRTVRWGDRSTDEMLIGYFLYRNARAEEMDPSRQANAVR